MPQFIRWSALSLRTKGLIVVGLPVLPLAMFWAIVVVAVLQQNQPTNTTTRSLIVQASLARVMSALQDADAGARDYVLTDNPAALERSHAAVGRIPADIAVLDNAVIDDEVRRSLQTLQQLVGEEEAVLAQLTGGVRLTTPSMGERGALDQSALNLNRIRAIQTGMEKRQAALATERSQQNHTRSMVMFFAFLIASVLCAAAGVIAALVLARSVSRRIGILAKNADRLARGMVPQALPPGQDEIGWLDAQIRETSRLLRLRDHELHRRTAELEAANKELEAFSYSVSHDLRAPLRAIDGFSEAIEQDCVQRLDDGGRDSLRRVRAAARRMGTLIDEMLNLSRLTRVELRRQPVNISATASAILADISRRGPDRPFNVQIEPDLVVDADQELVHIALHNLLENAWKYTGKTTAPSIEIGSSPNGAARVIHIRDNGAGFDMSRASKLFGAFQRLHHDRDFEGTGIGLAIVQRIVNRHGGRIWAESEVNAGATFYFTLEPESTQHA